MVSEESSSGGNHLATSPEEGIIWNEVDWTGRSRVSRNSSAEGDDDGVDPLTVPPRPQSRSPEARRRAGSESQGSEENGETSIPLRRLAGSESQRSEENGDMGGSVHSVSQPHVFHRCWVALRRLAGSESQRSEGNGDTGRSAHSHPRGFRWFWAAPRRLAPWNRNRPREQPAPGTASSSAPSPRNGNDGAAPQEPQAAHRRGATSQGQQTMGANYECWWKSF